MYRRVNFQPDPMNDYILEDTEGNAYLGRWLVGNTYEGWYIKRFTDPSRKPTILSQKELKIVYFYENNSMLTRHRYVPKKILDNAFCGRMEIEGFSSLEMLCYV